MFTLSLSLIIILTTIDKPNIELKISPNVHSFYYLFILSVCQWTGRYFSPVSFNNKTDLHDI
jgi:hypothetical protein